MKGYLITSISNNKKIEQDIEYDKYIICLSEGYNCLNYLNHFNSLVAIDDFKDISELDLNVIEENLSLDEIVISTSLSDILNKKEGDYYLIDISKENLNDSSSLLKVLMSNNVVLLMMK